MNILKYAFLLALCGMGSAMGFFGVFAPVPAPFFGPPVYEEFYDEFEDDYYEPCYRPVRRVHHVRHYAPRPFFAPRPFVGFGMCKPGFSFHIGL